MKISIPIEIKKEGGVYSFLSLFIDYLEKNSIHHTNKIDGDEDILFTNSWVLPCSTIKKAKKKNRTLKVLHRIDGSAKDYGRHGNADKIQSKVNRLADLTVFQSYYGRYATKEKFNIIRNDGPIIYNPVDIDLFTPDGERIHYPYKIKVCCATFSTNPKKGRDIIFDLADTHVEYDFLLCGRYDDAPVKTNIHPLGLLDRFDLATVLRSCDIFLFPSQNETCANVVLEAMSSGLPIIYHPSGGTHEIVDDCGLPLKRNFKDIVTEVLNRKNDYSTRARTRAVNEFRAEKIFHQYITAISQTERKTDKNTFFKDIFNRIWPNS